MVATQTVNINIDFKVNKSKFKPIKIQCIFALKRVLKKYRHKQYFLIHNICFDTILGSIGSLVLADLSSKERPKFNCYADCLGLCFYNTHEVYEQRRSM
jgi:hypothetical protein